MKEFCPWTWLFSIFFPFLPFTLLPHFSFLSLSCHPFLALSFSFSPFFSLELISFFCVHSFIPSFVSIIGITFIFVNKKLRQAKTMQCYTPPLSSFNLFRLSHSPFLLSNPFLLSSLPPFLLTSISPLLCCYNPFLFSHSLPPFLALFFFSSLSPL